MRAWLRERRARRLVRLLSDSEHERSKWGWSHSPSTRARMLRQEARWGETLERIGLPSDEWLETSRYDA